MAESYLAFQPDTLATFDLFVRRLPARRSYLVACGLEDVLEYLRGLRFTPDDIGYLRGLKVFSPEFLAYLKGFSFSGDVWAMPEGTVCFPYEPLVRVTAPLIQAQIVEGALLNAINLQTMIASKASRVVHAAQGRSVFDFSLRRTHGSDAAVKVARAAYLAGCGGTSNVLAGKRYGIPVAGTMAHSFVMSFKDELDSFLAYARIFPDKTILLVDTYDTRQGVEHAVTVGLFLKQRGFRLQGIRLDSGDLAALAKAARRRLDAAGLRDTKIVASGNLDESGIRRLLAQGAPIDVFGVGTNMGTSSDAPVLDVIYKTCEVTDERGRFIPRIKLSKDKVTYPGRKQVVRISDAKGRYLRDVLVLEGEKVRGEKLLVPVMRSGRVVYRAPSLEVSRRKLEESLARFSGRMLQDQPVYTYPVRPSAKLQSLRNSLLAKYQGRSQRGHP